jgi:hypothetical protein
MANASALYRGSDGHHSDLECAYADLERYLVLSCERESPLLERNEATQQGGLSRSHTYGVSRVLATEARPIIPTTGSQSASLIQVNFRLECTAGHSERPLIMPTDLDSPVAARKREAQAKTRTLVTMTLVWIIISLGILWLLLEVWQ